MNPICDFEHITREARALRRQFIGELLRSAWNAVVNRLQIFRARGQGQRRIACPQ
jgi:hypothetical protein